MAGDMHWGMNPVLYASLLKGAGGVEGAEKQTQVWSQPCPAVFCFLSALLWESSNEAEKQNRGQGSGGCVMLLPHVPVPPCGTWHWRDCGRGPSREGTSCLLNPRRNTAVSFQVTGQQGTWVQGEGICRQTGLFALKQLGHCESEEALVRIGRAHGCTGVLPPSFVWHSGSAGALLSAEGHWMESLERILCFPLSSLFCTARVKSNRQKECHCWGIASG